MGSTRHAGDNGTAEPTDERSETPVAAETELATHVKAFASGAAEAPEAALVIERVAQQEPRSLAPFIRQLVLALYGDRPGVAQTCALVLPQLTKIVPAKIAKQIPTLREGLPGASPTVTEATVLTFVGLCAASVTYQRRLIDLLQVAIRDADLERMERWAAAMLPTLKGEPYAAARQEVETRLADLPRSDGQRIAATLGLTYRGRRVPE